jgi:hypothetical protein
MHFAKRQLQRSAVHEVLAPAAKFALRPSLKQASCGAQAVPPRRRNPHRIPIVTTAAPTIIAILTHTPVWVWAIFALVAYMGYQRTRDRIVYLWRLLLFPLMMIAVAVSGMITAGLSVLPAILVGLAIGGVTGWLLERDGATRRLPGGKLWLRGEWWSLVQVLLILVFRYTTAVIAAVDPALGGDPTFHLVTAFVSSLLSAMILGRTLARLKVYFTSAPVAA